MKLKLLMLSTCLCALGACASLPPATHNNATADINRFAEDIQLHAPRRARRALVVFDIDNTLLAMEQGLGSDQWYEWQKEQSAVDRCDPRVVANRLAVQGALYFASAMRPTQADAAATVRRLQDAGYPVIALTSRGVGFRLQTFRELRRNGFDFRRSAIGPPHGWEEDFVPTDGGGPARYEDGVFLTTGQHKGAMLAALIERTGHPMPEVIFMLDDKQSNLDALHESFDPLGVPVRSWRYSGEDPQVTGFDADLSEAMWRDIEPALRSLEQVLGPDHYQLGESTRPSGCPG